MFLNVSTLHKLISSPYTSYKFYIDVNIVTGRREFAKGIETGKLCLVNADLLMVFCLQALGLNPYIILAMVNDIETHHNRIMSYYIDCTKETTSEIRYTSKSRGTGKP